MSSSISTFNGNCFLPFHPESLDMESLVCMSTPAHHLCSFLTNFIQRCYIKDLLILIHVVLALKHSVIAYRTHAPSSFPNLSPNTSWMQTLDWEEFASECVAHLTLHEVLWSPPTSVLLASAPWIPLKITLSTVASHWWVGDRMSRANGRHMARESIPAALGRRRVLEIATPTGHVRKYTWERAVSHLNDFHRYLFSIDFNF